MKKNLGILLILMMLFPVLASAAGETAAEPIRAYNLCKEAQARERARPGSEPYVVGCWNNVRSPGFWQCVLKAMEQDKDLRFSVDLCSSLERSGP